MNTSFRVNTASGLIEPARQCPSPNQDARPAGAEPELLIVHGISLPPGEFGGPEIEQLFTNALDWDAHPYFDEIRNLQVSSHLLIRRDGELLQFVPFTQRAWHAGECALDRFFRELWIRKLITRDCFARRRRPGMLNQWLSWLMN